MDEVRVSTSILEHISYHNRVMYIKLKNGKLFSYNSVPREVFDEFIKTDTHDEFYTKRIVPAFSFQRMA
jgi:hypothetical protein